MSFKFSVFRRSHLSFALSGMTRLLISVLIFFSTASAEQALVAKDGSLIFTEPSSEAAVLDIVPRGTRLEVMEQTGDWCKVLLEDTSRTGFIRRDALQLKSDISSMSEMAPVREESLYGSLQRQLDNCETKLRQAQRLLDNLEQMIDLVGKSSQAKGQRGRGSRRVGQEKKKTGENFFTTSYGFSFFTGFYLDRRDVTTGGSVVWSPVFFKGLGLEFEGGYTFLEQNKGAACLNLGLVYPLPWKMPKLRPYAAFGGGMIRFQAEGADSKAVIDPTLNLGAGALVPLFGKVSLRADMRSTVEFADSERRFDGRFYLALHYH
ncbi:MAG TPA: SH3 domain-containing protein [archaeon]|nr:SH3 domain-containing protein [archaeon]